MKWAGRFFGPLVCLIFLAACASSGVEETQSDVGDDEVLNQPGRIVVGEFTATPDRIPDREEIKEYFEDREEPISAEEAELGRQLGDRVAENLVEKIQEMGIQAVREGSAGPLALNDVLIEGYFVTIDEGDRLQRMLIGFGAGAAELRTLVEVYQQTEDGLRNLGFAEIEAEGGKMPGMLVPVGAGAASGELARSVIISGVIATAKEVGPETIEAAAERTAEEIAGLVEEGYEKRGWR